MFYIYNVKKIACFLVFLSIFFVSCDKGCTDENACNNGVTTEPCKYSDEQEAILEGEWTLKDVYDIDGVCLFSKSDDIDGEWEDNKANGFGTYTFKDGTKYIGYWKDDKKNGYGKAFHIKSGKVEEGNWINGEFMS